MGCTKGNSKLFINKKRGNRKIGDMTLPPQEKKNEFV